MVLNLNLNFKHRGVQKDTENMIENGQRCPREAGGLAPRLSAVSTSQESLVHIREEKEHQPRSRGNPGQKN
jgi:hypothetical protein